MPRKGPLPPIVLADVIDAYRAGGAFQRLSRATKASYDYGFYLATRPSVLGQIPTRDLTPRLIQKFLDAFADRPATQSRVRSALRALETWAIVRETDDGRPFLTHQITFGTQVLTSDGAREPWTDGEIELAIAHAAPMLARAVQLALFTAQRAGDLVRMRWADIGTDPDGRPRISLVQQKTDLPLYVPILPELEAAMRSWDRSLGYLLVKPSGGPWTRPQLSSAWNYERDNNAALEPLRGKKLSLHGLRASAVIRLRRAGCTELEIAAMVGMSTKMVTRYSRRAAQWENAVAALKRLGTAQERNNVAMFRKKPSSD